ncbi:hypothetical protein BDV10DRAFT_191424 [Aspergillus recurvatus]
MNWYLSLLSLSCFLLLVNAREKYNFNQNWKVYVGDPEGAESPSFGDGGWKEVTTPYAWNENDAFRVSIANLSTEIVRYRKHSKLPTTANGDKVFLEFKGIRHAGEFYLNGKWIGRSENGVMAFGFDITDTKLYANYGRVNKNVFLHVTNRVHQTLPLYSNLNTTGVYVYAQNVDVHGKSVTVAAEAEVWNEYETSQTFSFRVEIDDLEGASETRIIHASSNLEDFEFWSWGYGYLYRVHTSLISDGKAIDTVTTLTGFRKTKFNNGIFKLNDRTLHLKGYAQRSTNEWPTLGSAVPPWLSDFSTELALPSNDRLGILQALPAGGSESDREGRRWEMRVELMRDAIICNRNNLSVVFYEAGNAGISEEHTAETKKLRDTYDPHGGRAAGSREILDSQLAEYGGKMLYINKVLRKYWDDYPPLYHLDGDGPLYNGDDASSYNRNQDSHAVEDVERELPSFREVDPVRLPKDGWYAHRVMWDNWVDIEKIAGHIIGHWNYNTTTTKDVYVVSTAELVELNLNGNSLGWGKQSSRFLFTFSNVAWEVGMLKAFGYSDGEEKNLLEEKRTSGTPASIRLTSRTAPDGFVPNGADIALIDFTLSGEATWRGGIAQGLENYILSKTLPVENGVNRVLSRSAKQAGKVTLRAESEGLKSASITVIAKSISVDSGLSTFMLGKDLRPNLSRGPTPAGESYVVSRRAVEVPNVAAGSAEDNATASIDDHEETTWRSDSDQDNAWIEYSWNEPVNVSQLVMKLRSFRTKQYPNEVSVDETVCFHGHNSYFAWSLRVATDEDDDLGIAEAEIYTPT